MKPGNKLLHASFSHSYQEGNVSLIPGLYEPDSENAVHYIYKNIDPYQPLQPAKADMNRNCSLYLTPFCMFEDHVSSWLSLLFDKVQVMNPRL